MCHTIGEILSLSLSTSMFDGHRSIVLFAVGFFFFFLCFSFFTTFTAQQCSLPDAGVRQRRHNHTHVLCNLDFVVVFILVYLR